jgi:hypothetical protein
MAFADYAPEVVEWLRKRGLVDGVPVEPSAPAGMPAPRDYAPEIKAAQEADADKERERLVGSLMLQGAQSYANKRQAPIMQQGPVDDAMKAWITNRSAQHQDRAERHMDVTEAVALRPKPTDPNNEPAPPEWGAPAGMTKALAVRAGYGKNADPSDVLEEELVARAKSLGVPTDKRKREPVIADILAAEKAGKDRGKDERTARNDATKNEIELRREFIGQQGYKDFQTVATNYEKVSSTSETGAGDISLIFAYMKMLDPGSTVREGEFATAANAGSVPQSILAAYNKAVSGEKLAPAVRQGFRSEAQRIFDAQQKRYGRLASQYSELAKSYGLDPAHVVFEPGRDAPPAADAGAPAPVRRFKRVNGKLVEETP